MKCNEALRFFWQRNVNWRLRKPVFITLLGGPGRR